MLKLVRRAAAVIVLPVAFAGAALAVSAAPSSAAVSVATMESQVLTLTNQQRVKHGCKAVAYNARLAAAARVHSRDMIARNYFSHVSPTGGTFTLRTRAQGYRYAIGENIAWGYRTASDVVNAWMKSPGHRANILNCQARALGVGVAVKSNGAPYWTQEFGRV